MPTRTVPCRDRPLSPPQAEVLERGLLGSGFSCVLQMPTGSGKTWLAEQAIADVLRQGQRAVYLTPLRALADELAERWQERFAPARVGVFTGDYGGAGKALPVAFADARLLVMTPERLDACTRAWRSHWHWLPEVDLVVVDEFHLLGDPNRGGRLEGALSRLERLNPFARLLCLSATLGNRGELADWLGGVEYASTWRPVPLTWRVVRYARATEKPARLLAEVQRNVGAGGRSLVFVQSRRRAEQLATGLAAVGLQAAHHHAGLAHQARRAVEGEFRGGATDVLVATATLEMGLNLPVRQVVLYDLQAFDGSDFQPLSTTSVWQRAGRAGRPGLDASGEVVLLAAAWDRAADHYAAGRFEPIRSALSKPRTLAEQIVVEVASGLAWTEAQLARVFQGSLAARQGALPALPALVGEMLQAGMLRRGREETGRESLSATRLGHIACRHMLTPATVLLFRRVLERGALTFLDLLLTAAASADAEPILPADFEELDDLAARAGAEPSVLLALPRHTLAELLGIDGKRLLAAVKMAVLCRDWTRAGDVERVAARNGCYPFEVDRLRESLARLLLALAALGSPDTEEVPVCERIGALYQMVVYGLDEEAATLTLVEGIGGVMAARLKAAGIADVEALAQAGPEDLAGVKGLSATRARRWIDRAAEVVRTSSAWRYREGAAPGCKHGEAGPQWPLAEFYDATAGAARAGGPAEGAPRGVGQPPPAATNPPPSYLFTPAALRPLAVAPAASGRIDPYRLRRARDLRVTEDGSAYRVTGGLEPHVVRADEGRLLCDCPDAAEGHLCKHVLAVRLHRQDGELLRLLPGVEQRGEAGPLDLAALWLSGGGTR
jgi:helicase